MICPSVHKEQILVSQHILLLALSTSFLFHGGVFASSSMTSATTFPCEIPIAGHTSREF